MAGRHRRFWYWPAWQMTRWWAIEACRGGDEYDRRTVSVHIGPLGCFNFATSGDGAIKWRCECGDLNRGMEAFCYRCGAGQGDE